MSQLSTSGAATLTHTPQPFGDVAPSTPDIDQQLSRALEQFKRAHPPRFAELEGARWEYVAAGEGPSAVLFLHGMGGALDVWWQQIEELAADTRVVAVSYPPLSDLASLRRGIMEILDREGIGSVRVVGSSLGGYMAQYLMSTDPDRIDGAILGNTFAPNDLLSQTYRRTMRILSPLPQWLFAPLMNRVMMKQLGTVSQQFPIVLAYLRAPRPHMGKRTLLARFRCVVERFEAPNPKARGIPVMIIECDDDPLIPTQLRRELKATYPSAQVRTMSEGGHFPYLSHAETYTALVRRFLLETESRCARHTARYPAVAVKAPERAKQQRRPRVTELLPQV